MKPRGKATPEAALRELARRARPDGAPAATPGSTRFRPAPSTTTP